MCLCSVRVRTADREGAGVSSGCPKGPGSAGAVCVRHGGASGCPKGPGSAGAVCVRHGGASRCLTGTTGALSSPTACNTLWAFTTSIVENNMAISNPTACFLWMFNVCRFISRPTAELRQSRPMIWSPRWPRKLLLITSLHLQRVLSPFLIA